MNVTQNLWISVHRVHQERHRNCARDTESKSHRHMCRWPTQCNKKHPAILWPAIWWGCWRRNLRDCAASSSTTRQGTGMRLPDYSQVIQESNFWPPVNNKLKLRSGVRRESCQGEGVPPPLPCTSPHTVERTTFYVSKHLDCALLLDWLYPGLNSKHFTVNSTTNRVQLHSPIQTSLSLS